MPMALNVQQAANLAGKSFAGAPLVIEAEAVLIKEVTLAAAKEGTLTTRTDNNTGTLTMDTGHGITTGARLDLYWEESGVEKSRRGMVVGTVSGNSVPIDLGAGDNLPIATTALRAMVPDSEAFVVTGDNVVGIVAFSGEGGQFVLENVVPAEVYYSGLLSDAAGGSGFVWCTGLGTNPLAGDSPITLYMSHGNPDASSIMRFGVLYN